MRFPAFAIIVDGKLASQLDDLSRMAVFYSREDAEASLRAHSAQGAAKIVPVVVTDKHDLPLSSFPLQKKAP